MSDKKTLLIPFLLIAVGVGWLLSALGIAPSIDWVWTLGLATIGILAFLLSGIDKFTVVVGPLFLFASLWMLFMLLLFMLSFLLFAFQPATDLQTTWVV